MGEAKRRGTYEERKSNAKPKNKQDNLRQLSSSLLNSSVWAIMNSQFESNIIKGNKKR